MEEKVLAKAKALTIEGFHYYNLVKMAQAVSINSEDAEVRGIKDGEEVKVYNDRGAMIIPAMVTERIMPGVVSIPEGAWYDPDETGVDRAGHANVLTKDEHSPGGAFPYNTVLVQIEKI